MEESKVVQIQNRLVGMEGGRRRTQGATSAVQHLEGTYRDLSTQAVPRTWNDAGVEKPARLRWGAYNLMTFAREGGATFFSGKEIIDRKRATRPLTNNAVELRCDALCLVVYASGLTRINKENFTQGSTVRLAIYHHDLDKPDVALCSGPEDMYKRLHGVLVSTYNSLASRYNLAGLTPQDLTLSSDHEWVPSVRLTDPL